MYGYFPLLLAPLLQSKGRLLASVFAIALGVALGYAIHVINRSALDEFEQALRTLSGDADLTVRGSRTGFDESLYAQLARLPSVAVASPLVEVAADIVGREDALTIVGVDVFRAALIQPALLAEAPEFLDTLRADAVFLSPAAREWLGAELGSRLAVQVGLRAVDLRVAGFLRADGARQRIAVMDIAAVQWRLGKIGQLTRIDLKLRPGADLSEAQSAVRALLPAGVLVERPRTSLQSTAKLTRAYRVNLNVLAMVALFTGGLLVFATQVLSVVRRRSHLALLRALGVTRTGLTQMLLSEGAVIGVVGAATGIGLGYGIALVVLRWLGADLGAGFFRGVVPTAQFDPLAALVFFLLGLAAAVLGSGMPALEAGRSAPALALKAGDDQRVFDRLMPWWPGAAALAVGVAAAFLPPVDGLPVFGYTSVALLLVGAILLMPRVLRGFLRTAPSPRSPMLALAHAQLANAPGPAATSLAAIVAAVSLTVSMAIMVLSFRTSLDDWLERVLPADLYMRAGGFGDTAFFSPEEQERIASVPGIRRVEFLRTDQVVLDSARPRITVIAREIDPTNPQARLPLVSESVMPPPGKPPAAWVSELMVDVYGLAPGQEIELPLAGRMHRFTIAGVWRDYARQNGSVVMEREEYARLTGDITATDAAVWLEAGVAPAQMVERLHSAMGSDRLETAEPSELRQLSLGIFDRSFAVTYALEAAAILIGLFGLSSGMASQVLARRREFGVLRHLGATRAQIGSMLAFEGVLAGAVGLVVGCLLGWVIALVLIYVVNRQSFHWSIDLHVPWLGLAGFVVAMLALASVTAWLSGRQAQTGGAIRAVREDW